MQVTPGTVLVIFGLTGDLSKRKLLPALYNLAKTDLLPEDFRIIGISRRGTTTADVRSLMTERIKPEDSNCTEVCATLFGGETDNGTEAHGMFSILDMNIGNPAEYGKLTAALADTERELGKPLNRLFYLAIPATLFRTVTTRLGESDININEPGIRESRFLIEKPFGYSLDSARELIDELAVRFDESQIFRIDHYLAKETVQNILAFRFENPLFCQAWNREHISHIMITAAEEIGIEGRTTFYENIGALRDLVQSHLLQLLALITMKRPKTLNAADIHREKEAILARIKPPTPERMHKETVRGQYHSYRDETGHPDSKTETYAAVWLSIDTDEWRDVPVFIRTGKALRQKVTEITMVYSGEVHPEHRNYLTIRIQPNEGIVIDLSIKKPGFSNELEQVQLDFCYNEKISANQNDAYERVLFDAIRGDQTLFATDDEVLSCWRITEPILEAWKAPDFPLYIYENNSWGPEEADRMIAETGVAWLTDTHTVCTLPRIIRPATSPASRKPSRVNPSDGSIPI